MNATAPSRIVLAVTGASGMPYVVALARELAARPGIDLHCIVSQAGAQVLELECGLAPRDLAPGATFHDPGDIAAPPASGSWRHAGLVVCPCSMASLSAIANGLGSTLIHRAADVALKEGFPLVLVPRETPLNRTHIANMLAACEAGAVILPAMPGFYHRPATLDDLAAHLAGKILDRLNLPHALFPRWGE
jgi:4-hydroxy-3-polyprenylbenzoate decarboxylase